MGAYVCVYIYIYIYIYIVIIVPNLLQESGRVGISVAIDGGRHIYNSPFTAFVLPGKENTCDVVPSSIPFNACMMYLASRYQHGCVTMLQGTCKNMTVAEQEHDRC